MTTPSRPVNRQRSQSGRVSFTDPIIIRSGRDTYLEVFLQFIPKTDKPNELHPKLRYWKKTKGAFRIGYPAEFTLNHTEARNLKEALEYGLALAEGSEDGSFLLLKLDGQKTDISHKDSLAVGRAVAGIIGDAQVLGALENEPDGGQILSGLQTSVRMAELNRAVRELEEMLESGTVREQEYQDWCDAHCWAFGHAYVMRDDVRDIALGDQVDVLMASTANGLRDVFELKRPDMDALKWDSGHRSWYWSADTAKAVGQCHRYLDALHEHASNGLRDHPEIVAYHPRAVIVIGRSQSWENPQLRGLHGLNARLHGIQVMTFDQLLAQARQLLSVLEQSG